LLFNLLKIPAQFVFWIYCRAVFINKPALLKSKGPLLIAANHPNSFLDAIVLATLFQRPVYSLARGDVYKNKFYSILLTSLNILPVYRLSEGAGNLGHNYSTFEKCREIFKKNGIVLIFSEGRCINEWKLRPLKKGTARLAVSSWEEGINLTVLPAGINYQSFTSFGKNIHLNFGNAITSKQVMQTNGHGNTINSFNNRLQSELTKLVEEIDKNDRQTIRQKFQVQQPAAKKIFFLIPALLGFILHAPLYFPVKQFAWRKASHNDHYDSVLVGLLFVLYPFYLATACLAAYAWLGSWYWMMALPLLPFCAHACMQLKKQF